MIEKLRKIQEYVDISNDEWGEYLQSLINISSFTYMMGAEFILAIYTELDSIIEYIDDNLEIVELEEIIPQRTIKRLTLKYKD